MRVVSPVVYTSTRPIQRRRRIAPLLSMVFLAIFSVYSYFAFTVQTTYSLSFDEVASRGQAVPFSIPSTGSFAVYSSVADTIVAEHRSDLIVSSASTMKLLTAIVVLEQIPYDEQKTFTINAEDVGFYEYHVSQNGSNVPVSIGQTYTYKNMLQALLIASANNIADTLAVRAYGSIDEFIRAANIYLGREGIESTNLADPSGLASQSTTTAADMIEIAELTKQIPVLDEITGQKQFIWQGLQYVNTNRSLGIEGINGLKTGTTDLAGACLVTSATLDDGLGEVLIAIYGQPSRDLVHSYTQEYVRTVKQNITERTIISQGQTVGLATLPWGDEVALKSTSDLKVTAWKGSDVYPVFKARQAESVATASVENTSVPLELASELPKPPLLWRYQHALERFF